MRTACPSRQTATALLVVPRSMPTIMNAPDRACFTLDFPEQKSA
jgi:hypothetical protein